MKTILSVKDFLLVIFALVFVYAYICVHTGSFAIGCFAILQIMISIPLALFPYATLMGVPFFSQVHILAIFLCLGVGADDVFVFMDAYKQSFYRGSEVNQSLTHRIADGSMDRLVFAGLRKLEIPIAAWGDQSQPGHET